MIIIDLKNVLYMQGYLVVVDSSLRYIVHIFMLLFGINFCRFNTYNIIFRFKVSLIYEINKYCICEF